MKLLLIIALVALPIVPVGKHTRHPLPHHACVVNPTCSVRIIGTGR
jgi:hypothetical protein